MTFIKPKRRLASTWSAILMLAIFEVFTCSPQRALALGPQPATKFTGVIQDINYQTKTVTFQPDAQGKSFNLSFGWYTNFHAYNKRVKADAFKAGMRVRVKYISPLFGREYATTIDLNPT